MGCIRDRFLVTNSDIYGHGSITGILQLKNYTEGVPQVEVRLALAEVGLTTHCLLSDCCL